MKRKTFIDSLGKFATGDGYTTRILCVPRVQNMTRRSFVTLATLTLMSPLKKWNASLQQASLRNKTKGDEPRTLFRQAGQLAQAGHADEALNTLRRSYEANYPTPQDALKQDSFRSLLRNPVHRHRLRRLLREFVKESVVTMVSVNEPGSRLTIRGSLRDARTSQPVPGAIVLLYHTDNVGLYAPESPGAGAGSENPRLFSYVMSDAAGRFVVHTIRPASYPGIRNMRHVHVEIEAAGYGSITSQFYINGDPAADEARRKIAAERDWPIVDPVQNDGRFTCDVVFKIHAAAR